MVMRDGVALALLGILLGMPIVFLGAKYLEKELFQMKPLEPVSATFALGILFGCALIAVGIPAIRASVLKPSETLRQE
jgi:ABC-type antimicrobial peptide transport system permease subunit